MAKPRNWEPEKWTIYVSRLFKYQQCSGVNYVPLQLRMLKTSLFPVHSPLKRSIYGLFLIIKTLYPVAMFSLCSVLRVLVLLLVSFRSLLLASSVLSLRGAEGATVPSSCSNMKLPLGPSLRNKITVLNIFQIWGTRDINCCKYNPDMAFLLLVEQWKWFFV